MSTRPLHAGDAELDRDVLIGDRRQAALDYVTSVRRRWQWLLDNLDLPLAEAENSSPTLASPPANSQTAPRIPPSSTACGTTRSVPRGRPN